MKASTADAGFFQQHPVLKNQFHDDPSLKRIIRCLFFFHEPYHVLSATVTLTF